ncbi:MAG: aconitase subunit 2 [Acidobacteria bacterium]|jgi:predicted aconitase with swiveling domain|nr:aconitase subunit 2 [Acidobacteriota bacterium]|tara:strand:+ start:624 stop:1067 length:444 start_codon:yes stop_codon:yes gene_type:complete
MGDFIQGKTLVEGEATGPALWSDKPLSFWGGYDQNTGEIIDRRHPLVGHIGANRIIAIPHTKGSSTSTAVLLEAVRRGKSPAAIITTGVASFLALASIVAKEMYDTSFPVLTVAEDDFNKLELADWVSISDDGVIEFGANPQPTSPS